MTGETMTTMYQPCRGIRLAATVDDDSLILGVVTHREKMFWVELDRDSARLLLDRLSDEMNTRGWLGDA